MPPRLPWAGLGLKDEHVAPLLDGGAAAVDFVEVHAENYLVDGGPRLRWLERVRRERPLAIHGVGLSLGGLAPPDARHLARVAALVRRFEPLCFSEHLAWSGHGGGWFADLLPLPYDQPTLDRVCAHVDRVQQAIGRPLLLENPSTYLESTASTMDEASFLTTVVERTGCGLLLDVNNAYVSACNHGRDPWSLIAALPAAAVGELHLAGHAVEASDPHDPLLIDNHGAPVAAAVWALYARTLDRLGPVPTLIERDHDVPALPVLAAEAAQARECLRAATRAAGRRSHAVPEGAPA